MLVSTDVVVVPMRAPSVTVDSDDSPPDPLDEHAAPKTTMNVRMSPTERLLWRCWLAASGWPGMAEGETTLALMR